MTIQQPYTYTILRYVHDVTTGEFVNVGVVMHLPREGRLLAKVLPTTGQMRRVFPDLDRAAFTFAMRTAQRGLYRIAKRINLFRSEGDASYYASQALPTDDSSLQWSPLGSGLTNDAEKTFARLYERFVPRYDTPSTHRRTDDDVWRPVKERLAQRNLLSRLQEKTIRGEVDQIVFKHAWRNGGWHVYEPVSFDLADAEGIKSKARSWLGHLSPVADDVEPFKPHFIVGAPATDGLEDAYRSALAILRKAPNHPEIYEESEVDDFVAKIEDEVRSSPHVGN